MKTESKIIKTKLRLVNLAESLEGVITIIKFMDTAKRWFFTDSMSYTIKAEKKKSNHKNRVIL